MRTIIVYESKYGHTKQYAQWLSEELGCAMVERKKANISKVMGYDIILYGGGLYAGGISGIGFLTKHASMIKDKHLILFTCGLADPTKPQNVASIEAALSKKMKPEILATIRQFHLRGGIDYTRLNRIHKAMMAMMYRHVCHKSKDVRTEEDEELIRTYGQVVDFLDRSSLDPLIQFVKTLQ